MSTSNATLVAPVERRLLSGPKNLIAGSVFALSPVTSLLVLGWFMRDMRRVAAEFSGDAYGATPGWIMDRDAPSRVGRVMGGLAANIKEGILAAIALALGTLPFAGFWIASWWAGWDNSFNKGYEQSLIGPATGLVGLAIFMVMMIYIPMAQAHLAVENRLSAFFEFARIRSAVRHAGWRYVVWVAGLVFFSLPIFAARGLVTFVEGIIPGFADYDAGQVADFQTGIALVMAVYIFVTLLIFRRRQARIYARAVLRAANTRDAWLWQHTMLGGAKTGQPDRRVPRIGPVLCFVLMLGLWWCLAALIYIGQFLNHDWHAWVTHPLIFLPWMP